MRKTRCSTGHGELFCRPRIEGAATKERAGKWRLDEESVCEEEQWRAFGRDAAEFFAALRNQWSLRSDSGANPVPGWQQKLRRHVCPDLCYLKFVTMPIRIVFRRAMFVVFVLSLNPMGVRMAVRRKGSIVGMGVQ